MKNNVFDLFTGKPVEPRTSLRETLLPQNQEQVMLERLENRFSDYIKKGDSVTRAPQNRLNKMGWYFLDTYKGDVQRKWGPQSNKFKGVNKIMPLPYDPRETRTDVRKRMDKINTICLGHRYDAFQWLDLKHGFTFRFLNWLRESGWKGILVINTRSDLIAHDQYITAFQLLKESGIDIQINVALDSENERLERSKRPGAPSILRRRKAIQRLTDYGLVAKKAS